MISETQTGRIDRYQNCVTKALGRVKTVVYDKESVYVLCLAHQRQPSTALYDPRTNRTHPVCSECIPIFFPNLIDALPDDETEEAEFICNHESCINITNEASRCAWCGKLYCTAHLSGGCCDGCDEDLSRTDESYEKTNRRGMSGS